MDDVEYAIFDPAPVLPAPPQKRGLARPQFRGPVPTADRLLQPGPPPAAPAPSLEMSRDPDQVEKARSEGKVVLRVPKMPVRLIPQFDRQEPPSLGTPWGIAAVEADRLPPGSQGEGVTVAILDTGIDAAHPAFQGLINADNYKDFTRNGLADNVGHGTHCAGIIFGRPVGGTRIGVAPGITQVLVGKIADKDFVTTTTELRQALVWAVDNGAQVISLSVGLDFLGHKKALEDRGLSDRVAMAQALNDYRDYTRFFDGLMRLIVAPGAAAKSALLVAACGNDSVPADGMRVQATLPAVAEHVLAVSALDQGLAVAPFCNALADLCGPGVGILSAAPGGGLAAMSGTSQAAPHVAAVAALWWQKLAVDREEPPTPDAVRNELLGAARRDRVAGDTDVANIGRGIALAPPPPRTAATGPAGVTYR